jgi:hypothetical protein
LEKGTNVSLDTSRFQLHTALKTVRFRWERTCEQWNDPVRRQFEKEFWNHVEPAVLAAVSALDKLAQVIGQLKQECSGDSE